MSDTTNREALFISHANPEDNAFVRWLGAKLAAMGYEVWADVMRLHGGSDWSRDLEDALRNRAVKLLIVCSPTAMEKPGVRNEIEIGAELIRELNDSEFYIPLRKQPFKPHVRIAHAQYIDFSKSWATGLAELVDQIVNVHKVPRRPGRPMEAWLASQTVGATRLVQQEERLNSNWLSFQSVPNTLYYSEPPSGFPLAKFQERTLHNWPIIPVRNGVVSFAEPDVNGLLAPDMPARRIAHTLVDEFLDRGWGQLEVAEHEAVRHFADLGNQAFENFLKSRGLTAFEGANQRLSWYGGLGAIPATKIRFNWPNQTGLRQIIGQSGKRRVHWHYAISGQVRSRPLRHLRLYARLIFSENGTDALKDKNRMHRLRRSFAKSWRNARWRDMLSAFLWWLTDGQRQIRLPVSLNHFLVLTLPALSFSAPVTVAHTGDGLPDEDDPDIDEEDQDEDSEDEGDDSVEDSVPDTLGKKDEK